MNQFENSGEHLFQELIELFSHLKKQLNEENEEMEKNRKEKQFYEQNKEWNNHYLEQLRQQSEEQKALISAQQKNFIKFNELKEDNCRMKASLLEMNSLLNDKEKEFKNKLETNETQIKRLKDCILENEVIINELKMDLNRNESDLKSKTNEMQNYYESKIQSLIKEWNDKYSKCLESNDDKIIEIKANCLRTIEKTKEEYEMQLIAAQNENKDLSERYSHLRLEFEARKMTTPFVNPNKSYKNSANVATVVPKSATNQTVQIQVFDSINAKNQQTVHLIQPKRKKLLQTNDLYLQFIKDQTSP